MTVKRPPSADYPVGFFSMDFKMVGNDGTEGMKGYMKTKKTSGGTQLQFYMPMTMGGTTYDYAVKANFNSDGSGTGATTMPNWTSQNQATGAATFQVAFNSDYFYKQKTANGVAQTAVCLNRNKYLTSAWRYAMYDSNGARVDINSGFPISATVSGTKYHGYIGYYGLWMPSEASIDNGSTVTKMDYSNPDSAGDNYTVRSWGGNFVFDELTSPGAYRIIVSGRIWIAVIHFCNCTAVVYAGFRGHPQSIITDVAMVFCSADSG
jgi:hypothetical protein